jgi:predicted DNA-binding protein (MmcQ/YjbR family)
VQGVHGPLRCGTIHVRAVHLSGGLITVTAAPLDRLREICLAFPEATERETWGQATFRVRDKIFAMAGEGSARGRQAVACKARPGLQPALVEASPDRFFVPPYVGPKGWIGVYLGDETDWDELADLVEESFRMTAPKRVARAKDRSSGPLAPW